MQPNAEAPPGGDALTVFHGHGARWLAPGFRHVFVALRTEHGWLSVDGRDGNPVLDVLAPPDCDLAAFYRAQGFSVVACRRRHRRFRWPWMAGTCVGASKRLLGVRAPWVLTPYQLFRHLTR